MLSQSPIKMFLQSSFFPLAATRHKNSFENSKDAARRAPGCRVPVVGLEALELKKSMGPGYWYCHPWGEKQFFWISRIPQKGHFNGCSTLAEQSFLVSDRVNPRYSSSKPSCRSPVNGTLLNLQKFEFKTTMRLKKPSFVAILRCCYRFEPEGELPRRRFEKPFLWNLVLKACVWGSKFPALGTGKICRAMSMSMCLWRWVEKVCWKWGETAREKEWTNQHR